MTQSLAMLAMLLVATLAGRWEGTIQVPGMELPFVLDLAVDASNRWTGSATFPSRGVKGALLTDLVAGDGKVSFGLKAMGEPKVAARLQPDGTLAGEFVQGGNRAPFVLHSVGEAQVEAPRPQMAVGAALEGDWEGEFRLNDRPLKAFLKLEAKTAKFKVVGRREFEIPIESLTEEAGFLTADSPSTGIRVELRFDGASKELRGVFRQGPMDTPLVLRKK